MPVHQPTRVLLLFVGSHLVCALPCFATRWCRLSDFLILLHQEHCRQLCRAACAAFPETVQHHCVCALIWGWQAQRPTAVRACRTSCRDSLVSLHSPFNDNASLNSSPSFGQLCLVGLPCRLVQSCRPAREQSCAVAATCALGSFWVVLDGGVMFRLCAYGQLVRCTLVVHDALHLALCIVDDDMHSCREEGACAALTSH